MPIIAGEVGTIAATAVAEILAKVGEDVETQLDASSGVTRTFVEGGWTALTAAESDAGLVLRDVQEIARVCGRHLVPHALTTTLLAGRWFGLGESELSACVTFPVSRDDGGALPYAVADTLVVTGDGLGPLPDGPVDDFSEVMPLAATSSAPPLDEARHAELAAVLAATATGCADTALARSVAWVQTREQFGRPIKAFQAVRHHLADLHIAREESWTCAVAAAHEPDDAVGWARTGIDRATTAIELAIQVHGGVGFTWEAGIHHLLRHVLQIETLLGAVMTDLVGIERDGRVAQLVLNRPKKLNAMNDELLDGFSAAVAELGADPDVSVVVISGAGGNFSVGFDVGSGHDGSTETYPDWETLRRNIQRWLAVWDAPKPFLTAVEGYCMGGATMLSVCADITVVGEDAVIGWPSLPLGGGLLSPTSAWLIGPKKAKELSYIAGSRLTGTEAAALGWANHAVPAGTALDRALELAGQIAKMPLDLLRLKKLALNRVVEQQGFRESILAGAEWDALAHTAAGTQRMTGKVAELGLKGAVSWFRSEENR